MHRYYGLELSCPKEIKHVLNAKKRAFRTDNREKGVIIQEELRLKFGKANYKYKQKLERKLQQIT